MKRGVQMFTVRDFLKDKNQMRESMKKIKAIGYDSIQGWAPPFMTVREYKELSDEAGLENCSSGGNYHELLTEPPAIAKAVENARILGVNLISIDTLPEAMRNHEDGFHKYAEGANKIAAELKKEGMKLLYHSHALEFLSLGGGRKGMDILMDETDPDAFHFCMDTHWLTAGGVSVVDWILKAKGRMSIVHFKDYAIGGGAEKIESVCKQFAEVGEGNIDWAKVIDACNQIDVEFAIVEQDVCPGNPFDSLSTSYKNMLKFGVI